jgi:hypothetical protein
MINRLTSILDSDGIVSGYTDINYEYNKNPINNEFMVGKFIINSKKLSEKYNIPSQNCFINTKKLNDDIISIKRKSGANIKEFPSLKVSNKVSKILKDIIGGKIIEESDINSLSPTEQIYLNKLSKYSDIQDRLNIPSPSKDQEEKEYNQFEIMKGEILSGNDSKELVKKFKGLILKFSREGKLPKGQVTEILSELVELGY